MLTEIPQAVEGDEHPRLEEPGGVPGPEIAEEGDELVVEDRHLTVQDERPGPEGGDRRGHRLELPHGRIV